MLDAAERFITDDAASSVSPLLSPSPSSCIQMPEVRTANASRYGERRQINLPTILLITLIHGVLIFALIHARQQVRHVREARLSVVNLMPPPPPPAAETPRMYTVVTPGCVVRNDTEGSCFV